MTNLIPPDAAPETLVRLAADAPKEAASHANTPVTFLLRLARHYPDEVLKNPGFRLTMIHDVGFIASLDPNALAALSRSPHAPDLLIEHAFEAATTPRRVAALLVNPALPAPAFEALREKLLEYDDNRPYHSLWPQFTHHVNHPTGPAEQEDEVASFLDLFYAAYNEHSTYEFNAFTRYRVPQAHLPTRLLLAAPEGRLEEAKEPPALFLARLASTPPDALAHLAQTNEANMELLTRVASNPNTPRETLHALALHPDAEAVRSYAKNVAANPNVAPETLREIVRFSAHEADVHRPALLNANLPNDVVDDVLENRGASACLALAERPDLTPTQQAKLASRPASAMLLAEHAPSLTTEAMREMLDFKGAARILLARPDVPEEIRAHLMRSEDLLTRTAAESYESDTRSTGHSTPRDADMPEGKLLDREMDYARAAYRDAHFALSHDLPLTLQESFSVDTLLLVRLALAYNPTLAPHVRERLRADADVRVRAAAERPERLEQHHATS